MSYENHQALTGLTLGKSTDYRDTYDASLLQGVPRSLNRDPLGFHADALPFVGGDIWTLYEISWLNARGLPQVAVGHVELDYASQNLVESKSFKLYMFAFRNHQSFMETITNNVLDDLRTLLNPCWCRVKGLFAPRGGTRIHVFAEMFKDGMPEEQNRLVREAVAAWKSEPDPHRP